MDAFTTLKFFEKWFVGHMKTCGVSHVDLSHEEGLLDGELAVKVKLTCPLCGNRISGAIRDDDLSQLVALLDPGKQN